MAAGECGRAVVVGGGIIGLLTARALSLEGWRVTLIEKGDWAKQASWAGGGILCPLRPWTEPSPVIELVEQSLSIYPGLVAQLERDYDRPLQFLRSGLVFLDADEGARAEAWALSRGYETQRVRAGSQIGEASLCLPWVHQIRNPRLCKALVSDAARRGITLCADEALTGWTIEADRVTAVCTSRSRHVVDLVCVCAGAWSADLLRDVGWHLPVEPVRGQMVLLRISEPESGPTAILIRRGTYLIPREPGLVLVGSTVEPVGFDASVTPEGLRQLRMQASELWPALAKAEAVHHWAGLRPGSPDGVPFIEPHPRIVNLWVHAGHYRNGLAMAPASAARLVARIGAC